MQSCKMFRSVVLLCVVAALVTGQSTQVNRCKAGDAVLPINAYVEGCTTPPCAVERGSDAVVNLVFRAPHDIRSMETLATVYLVILPVQYPLDDAANTCNFLTNTECPISAGDIVKYTLRIKIEDILPLITVDVEFRIVDENRNPITCIALPVTVVPAANRDNALDDIIADN